MSEVTQWFDPSEKPMRKGVYETRPFPNDPEIVCQHWNGKYWGGYASAPISARHNHKFKSAYQSPLWRGLANPPEQSK